MSLAKEAAEKLANDPKHELDKRDIVDRYAYLETKARRNPRIRLPAWSEVESKAMERRPNSVAHYLGSQDHGDLLRRRQRLVNEGTAKIVQKRGSRWPSREVLKSDIRRMKADAIRKTTSPAWRVQESVK